MLSAPFIIGCVRTGNAEIPRVSTSLSFSDFFGTIKARWAINRYKYRVDPGLYAVGEPDNNSMVFVTANYKLSFDQLRKNLSGLNAWILVLNTFGINVWCAGGKGTFGTEEILKQIKTCRLDEVVTHRKLILPQLGANGISAHKVREQSGFHVIYGPIRAADIKTFLENGMKATKEMRLVRFSFIDRLILTPVEIMVSLKYLVFSTAAFIILSGLYAWGYSADLAILRGARSAVMLSLAYFSGTLFTPLLLPWIPFRAFSLKGAIVGLMLAIVSEIFLYPAVSHLEGISWILMFTGISSYLSMNFTGSSTYTNLSGVIIETRQAIPWQIISTGLGLILWLISLFIFV